MLSQKFFDTKMKCYEELVRKGAIFRSIKVFYNIYGVALGILKIKDKNYSEKCLLWYRYLTSSNRKRQDEFYKQLEAFMQKDLLIIFEAQEKLKEMQKEEEYADDYIHKSRAVGIVSYIHPANKEYFE